MSDSDLSRQDTSVEADSDLTPTAFREPQLAGVGGLLPVAAISSPLPAVTEMDVSLMQRYLRLVTGEDDPIVEFATPHDAEPKSPQHRHLLRRCRGRLDEVVEVLTARQQRGAAIHVHMAETDGLGRKAINMVRPRCVWIEADRPVDEGSLPLPPTISIETSPGRRHYIWRVDGLEWELWDALQRTLVEDYGSDPQAALRTQVLRVAGSLHQKNPTRPHFVTIIDDFTCERAYTVEQVIEAFQPRPIPPKPARVRQTQAERKFGGWGSWTIEEATAIFTRLSELMQMAGRPITTRRHRDHDRPATLDWKLYSFWMTCMRALHHGCGGSDAAFQLSKKISAGDPEMGLVGAPEKFNAEHQLQVWYSLGDHEDPVTMATVVFYVQELEAALGIRAQRRGRGYSPPEHRALSGTVSAVSAAAKISVEVGFERFVTAHKREAIQRHGQHSLKATILTTLASEDVNPATGIGVIASLAGFAARIGSSAQTVRHYLRELTTEPSPLLVKSDGREACVANPTGSVHRGIVIALQLPQDIIEQLRNAPNWGINLRPADTSISATHVMSDTVNFGTDGIVSTVTSIPTEHVNAEMSSPILPEEDPARPTSIKLTELGWWISSKVLSLEASTLLETHCGTAKRGHDAVWPVVGELIALREVLAGDLDRLRGEALHVERNVLFGARMRKAKNTGFDLSSPGARDSAEFEALVLTVSDMTPSAFTQAFAMALNKLLLKLKPTAKARRTFVR